MKSTFKFSLVSKKLKYYTNKEKLFVLPLLLFLLSHLIINIGYQDFNVKNKQIIFISAVMTFFSVILFIFGRSTEYKTRVLRNMFKSGKLLIVFVLLFLIVELLNFRSIYNLRIPLFFVSNIVMAFLIINFTIDKNNLYCFIYTFAVLNLIILIFSSSLSLIIRVLPNEIFYYNDKVFEHTNYILGIGLRQQRYRTENRFFSIFNNPSHFGEFGYLSVVFLQLYKYVTKNEKYGKFSNGFYLLSVISIFVSLINSKARVAVLSVVFFLIIELYINYTQDKNKLKKIITKRNVVILIFTILFCSLAIIYLFKSRGGFDNNGRFRLYQCAMKTFIDNPLIGVGVKEFYELISKNFMNAHAHNSFLQLLASGGIVFFMTYCFFYGLLIKLVVRIKELNPNLYKIIYSFVLSTIFFQQFDNKVLGIHYQFQLLVCIYLVLSVLKNSFQIEIDNVHS